MKNIETSKFNYSGGLFKKIATFNFLEIGMFVVVFYPFPVTGLFLAPE